jgi:hypothetical protein
MSEKKNLKEENFYLQLHMPLVLLVLVLLFGL